MPCFVSESGQRSTVVSVQTAEAKAPPASEPKAAALPELNVADAQRLGAALASNAADTVKAAAETITRACFDGPVYNSGKQLRNDCENLTSLQG